jgi:hypothetical protein
VYIFWSTGHETLLYSGDEDAALSEYQKALRFSNKRLEQLPRQPSNVHVREHHVVEFLTKRAWDIDPIRTRKMDQYHNAMLQQNTWGKEKFPGTIVTVRRSSRLSSDDEKTSIVPIGHYTQLQPLVWHLGVASSYRTLVVIGDDQMEEAEQNHSHILKAICSEIVDAARTRHGIAVVDRARKSIVTQLLGSVLLTYPPLPYIGVASAQEVDISELELAHAIILLVPRMQRTDEATWLAKTASVVAGTRPSLALLVHGNEGTWADVFAQLGEHRRVVALEGTGGIADLLSSAARGEQVDDERAARCVASGLIRTVPVDAFDEIKQHLDALMSLFPPGMDKIGIPQYGDLEAEFVEVSGKTIKIHVPRLQPIMVKEDWFTIEKWFVKEGDIVHPGDILLSIECAPGFFEIPTPEAVKGPSHVSHILVPAGGSTHLGDLILVLEQDEEHQGKEDVEGPSKWLRGWHR